MRKIILVATGLVVTGFVVLSIPAFAQDRIEEGRSVSTCSKNTLVCAFMKDGASVETSECEARMTGAVRIVPGDCFDED